MRRRHRLHGYVFANVLLILAATSVAFGAEIWGEARPIADTAATGKPNYSNQWAVHRTSGWDTVYRMGYRGAGVVVVYIDITGNDEGGECSNTTDPTRRYTRWTNAAECSDPTDPTSSTPGDSDGNGCEGDCAGCNWDHATSTPQQDAGVCGTPFNDYLNGPGGEYIGANNDPNTVANQFGRYPDSMMWTVMMDRDDPAQADAVGIYLSTLYAANTDVRFITAVRTQDPTACWTQNDCDNIFLVNAEISIPEENLVIGMESITNTILVDAWSNMDVHWAVAADHLGQGARWVGMGLLDDADAPCQQGATENLPSSPTPNASGFYFGPLANSLPTRRRDWLERLVDHNGVVVQHNDTANPMARFVAYAAGSNTGVGCSHSYQHTAPLTYVVPIAQLALESGVALPTEENIRDYMRGCVANAESELQGPDNLGGWLPGYAYGMPSVTCVLEAYSVAFSADIDKDGVTDNTDNCIWHKNASQDAVCTPGRSFP